MTAVHSSSWSGGERSASCSTCRWRTDASNKTAAARRHVDRHPFHTVTVRREQWRMVYIPELSR